jgi:hypothetical protein
MNEIDKRIAGGPSKRLIKEVRKQLWRFGIKPMRHDLWLLAWQWASDVADSYRIPLPGKVHRKRWPATNEIASQYLMLLLVEMRSCCALRLPYRAADHMPAGIKQRVANLKEIVATSTQYRRSIGLEDSQEDRLLLGVGGVSQ